MSPATVPESGADSRGPAGTAVADGERRRWISIVTGVAIGALAFGVFYLSPNQHIRDAKYTLLLSEHLLLTGSFALDEHFYPEVPSRDYPAVRPGNRRPRHVEEVGDDLYYIYPPGTSVLSAPLVAVLRAFGYSTIGPGNRYDYFDEVRMQRILAPLLMGIATGVFFLTARTMLGVGASALVAIGGGFGTQVWSTASRSLQSHCWLVLLLAIVLWLVLRAECGRGERHPVLLASLLAWCFFVRPTAAFVIVPLTLWLGYVDRRDLRWWIGAGLAWGALLVAYSQALYGTLLPSYYFRGKGLLWDTWPVGLAAELVSPSRGLFVYVPTVLVVAYLLVAYRRHLRHRGLVCAALAAVATHVVIVAAYRNWWAGRSYGPRFTTDLVPLFVLLAVLALRAFLDARSGGADGAERGAGAGRRAAPGGPGRSNDADAGGAGIGGGVGAQGRSRAGRGRTRRRLEVAALVVTMVFSIVLNGAGPLSAAAVEWNRYPVPIQQDPYRIFDWSRPHFACALYPPLLYDDR